MVEESESTSLDPEMPGITPLPNLDADPEFSPLERSKPPSRPWGPWATLGWTLLQLVVFVVAQLVAAVVFLVVRTALTGNRRMDDLGSNGNLLASATLLSTLSMVSLTTLLVLVRRYPIRDYLALYWPPGRSVLNALAGLAVLLVATDATSYSLGKPLVPTLMVDVYRSSWLPALVFTLVVLAPIGEETLFRGFLYKGLAESRGGPVLAIVISSLGFAAMHGLQYEFYAVVGVAAMGFYLSYMRYRYQSLFLTILLHAVANGFATLELIIQESWLK